MHLRATTSGYVAAWGSWVAARDPTPGNLPERCPSRFITLTAENGLPASLRWPSAASSRDISRSERCPPFGRLRRSCFARATTSGRNSAWLLRPSHLPVAARRRSRATRSLETRRVFSYSANAPATCRIILRAGSLVSVPSEDDGSIPPEVLEAVRRQCRVDGGAGDRSMAEPPLDRPGIVALVGERVAAGMAEHVGVRLDLKAGSGRGSSETRKYAVGRPLWGDHSEVE